ncbi:MAG TPA: sigma-70 family RNA polymerase sigma factor [Elusimicrobiota bacterium]|nr:sigma-70 family RNA polymerase sigma factor [Elusimicrobiota bacterium]
MLSEPALIEKSKQGDAEAFSSLIRRYEDKIYNLAHHVCASAPAEADDIYQETFLSAYKKIGQFRADSQLGTWLYRIAANLCWMRLRKKRREPFVPILDLPDAGEHRHTGAPLDKMKSHADDPAKLAQKKELRQTVERALEELPVEYRLVAVLSDIEGLPNDEIARILNLSLPAVKSRLHRARLFLRDRLSPLVKGHAS